MNARHYALALTLLLRDSPRQSHPILLDQFFGLLRRQGRLKLLSRILRRFEEIALRDIRKEQIAVITAGDASDSDLGTYIAHCGIEQKGKSINHRRDLHIISGYIVRTRNQRYDASAKSQLLQMYHQAVD